MMGRLTLNLRMYDPAAHSELTFPIMTLRLTKDLNEEADLRGRESIHDRVLH